MLARKTAELIKPDAPKSGAADAPKLVPKGYCLKKYDIGFGYDNVLDLLLDETVMGRVCGGDLSALPLPKLLSINCKTTEINGDYKGGCHDWDLAQNLPNREEMIYRELAQGEALKKINEHGQKALHSLAALLCHP
jgi:hypothetical protein